MTVLIAAAAILLVIFAVFGSVTASADTGKKPVRSVERGDNKIALTFNCAWDAGDIDALLSALSDGSAAATFFVTGEFCDAHPDAVKRIAASGHSVQSLTDKNIHIKGMNINDLIALFNGIEFFCNEIQLGVCEKQRVLIAERQPFDRLLR